VDSLRGSQRGWAHFAFTRINLEPTIVRKKIEDLRQLGAFHSGREVQSDPGEGGVDRHYGVYSG